MVHPVVHKEARRALTRRFPYGIFYMLDPATIAVIAVFHTSRDPRQWQARLGDPTAQEEP
jgi:plasmid stabilization system protein ParE